MSTKEVPFGFIKDNKIYLKSWSDNPDREIGEVREEDEKSSVAYFTNRFNELVQKISELEEAINTSENKGSFLMKLIHLKESLPTHDGLGDYVSLHDKLVQLEANLNEIIEKNRVKNTEIKQGLIDEMKAAVEVINWQEATDQIHDIKTRWIKTGNATEDVKEKMEEEFWGYVSAFFDKKKLFYEDKKLLFEKRKEGYEQLVKEAETLVELTGKERFEKVKDLKARWEELGNIPKIDYSDLAKKFTFYLKRKKDQKDPADELRELIKKLQGYVDQRKEPDFRELDNSRKYLFKIRPIDGESRALRKEALKITQLLLEKDFLEKLACKRFKDFNDLESSKKKNIRVDILKELISRDQHDLSKFQENSQKFAPSNENMRMMVNKKLVNQQNKIEVKLELLKMINES